MPQKQKLGIEKKVKIVKRYLAGEVSISTAAAEVGVGRETLQGWVMQYEAERTRSLFAKQEKSYIQSGIKAASGTGVPVRKRKSGRAQQKIWVAE